MAGSRVGVLLESPCHELQHWCPDPAAPVVLEHVIVVVPRDGGQAVPRGTGPWQIPLVSTGTRMGKGRGVATVAQVRGGSVLSISQNDNAVCWGSGVRWQVAGMRTAWKSPRRLAARQVGSAHRDVELAVPGAGHTNPSEPILAYLPQQ